MADWHRRGTDPETAPTFWVRREARGGPVSSADLVAFGETCADLGNDEVMSCAWR